MASNCPKCGKTVLDDSTYYPYCAHGLKPSARTIQVSVASSFLVIATVESFIFPYISIQAPLNIYKWYPQLVAQKWFIYDQLLAILCLSGMLSGLSASMLSLSRRSYKWTVT